MENNLKRIYINRKLNHFAIHLKLAQYCKKNSKKFLKISISKKNCDRFFSQFIRILSQFIRIKNSNDSISLWF